MEKGNLQKPSKNKHVQQMHYLLTFKDIIIWDTLTHKTRIVNYSRLVHFQMCLFTCRIRLLLAQCI